MKRFNFERLDVFRVAVDMTVLVDSIAEALPPGRGYMRDQLRRAANSVTLNIAEGAGEFSPGEKARFYRMAKRSATETAAQLVVADRLGLGPNEELEAARALLLRVVAMLVKLSTSAA